MFGTEIEVDTLTTSDVSVWFFFDSMLLTDNDDDFCKVK